MSQNQLEEIKAQSGPQSELLSCDADIAFFGGGAGGSKTFSLILDCARHINTSDAGAIFFRRTYPQIKAQGSLWDAANAVYRRIGGIAREGANLDITFPSGFVASFRSMQHENNKYDYQGSEIPVIYFDEVTQFSRSMFIYMLSRNRSTSGIKPYVRATCNPDKSSWVRQFISWWLDDATGLAIPERSGVIRWLVVHDDIDYWFDTEEKALAQFSLSQPISVTFIPSKLTDNKILMTKDPGYLSKLMALDKVERERLLGCNWNIMPAAGMYFKRHYFTEIDVCPRLKKIVRCWDRAATDWKEGDKGEPDGSAGIKMGQTYDNQFVILDAEHQHYSAHKVEKLIVNTARQDGVGVKVKGFQDPGGAGKGEADAFIKMLAGFDVTVEKISNDKITSAKAFSAQAEAGNVFVLSSCRNKEKLYSQLENFPDDAHDDFVDGCSGAFNELNLDNTGNFTDAFVNNIVENESNTHEMW